MLLYSGKEGETNTTNAVLLQEGVGNYVRAHLNAGGWRTERIQVRPLDEVALKQGIDACHLLKLDIEGAELSFLKGAEGFLNAQRPILYGEFHPTWMEQSGYSFVQVAELVQSWGYAVFRHVGGGRFVEVSVTGAGLSDVLLLPDKSAAAARRLLRR